MKRLLRGLGWALAAAAVLALAYAGYVLIGSARIEDKRALDVAGGGGGALETGAEYALVTWNIGFGAHSNDYRFFMDGGGHSRALSKDVVVKNTAAMLERLEALNADFMLLQEVDRDSDRSHHVDQDALIEAAFPDRAAVFALNYNSPYLFYPPARPVGRSVSGLLTFARAGIVSAVRRSLPLEEGLSRLADIDRCYTVARIPVEGGAELCLYNLHLSACSAGTSVGDQQLRLLLADMSTEAARGNYAVAAGDFSRDLPGDSPALLGVPAEDLAWARPFSAALLPDNIRLAVPEGGPSCRNIDAPYAPGETFAATVDGFLLSENVELLSATVLDEGFLHSDHNPAALSFRLLAE